MTTAVERELADLRSKLGSQETEAAPIRATLAKLDSAIDRTKSDIKRLEAKIAQAKKAPRVSDHAVIRYLERQHNFSFEDVREKLLTPSVKQAIRFGASGVKVEGGTLKISGNYVTTFVEKRT